MIFKSTYIKLTIFYVLIVMTISISFSIAIYNISSKELNYGLNRQTQALRDVQNFDLFGGQNQSPVLENIRNNQLEKSNNTLKNNLIYFNLIILGLSTIISYLLAKKTLRPIEEAMESQSRFTADASHELRTPLTAMRTEIEVGLREKKLNLESAKKLLKSNLEETEKLENLSNALLKLSRFENNNINFENVDLEDIISEAYQRLEKTAQIKEIEFENNLQSIKVEGDRASLIELFAIFLDNAIKYSYKKSKVYITMRKADKFSSVEIRDEGIGIKESDKPYIFNRFYRADPSRSKVYTSGYGLGLSIAQKILDLHNGHIKIKSSSGRGSSFTIYLPLKNNHLNKFIK